MSFSFRENRVRLRPDDDRDAQSAANERAQQVRLRQEQEALERGRLVALRNKIQHDKQTRKTKLEGRMIQLDGRMAATLVAQEYADRLAAEQLAKRLDAQEAYEQQGARQQATEERRDDIEQLVDQESALRQQIAAREAEIERLRRLLNGH